SQLEVPRHDPAQRLGIEPLTQGRRADHVAEQDGDRLANLAGGSRGRLEGRPAREAELRHVGVVLPAPRTVRHGAKVRARLRPIEGQPQAFEGSRSFKSLRSRSFFLATMFPNSRADDVAASTSPSDRSSIVCAIDGEMATPFSIA